MRVQRPGCHPHGNELICWGQHSRKKRSVVRLQQSSRHTLDHNTNNDFSTTWYVNKPITTPSPTWVHFNFIYTQQVIFRRRQTSQRRRSDQRNGKETSKHNIHTHIISHENDERNRTKSPSANDKHQEEIQAKTRKIDRSSIIHHQVKYSDRLT